MKAYVGLGANLGNARRAMLSALRALARLPATRVLRRSSLYRSAPIDAAGPDYWNAVALLETRLPARRLMNALLQLEGRHRRERPYRNAPRTLDMDLLIYGGLRRATHRLTVPHPRMTGRAFVLLPLLEVDPCAFVPGKGLAKRYLPGVRDQRIAKGRRGVTVPVREGSFAAAPPRAACE